MLPAITVMVHCQSSKKYRKTDRHTHKVKQKGLIDHGVKVLSTKSEDLNIIPRTHMYERNDSCKLSSKLKEVIGL